MENRLPFLYRLGCLIFGGFSMFRYVFVHVVRMRWNSNVNYCAEKSLGILQDSEKELQSNAWLCFTMGSVTCYSGHIAGKYYNPGRISSLILYMKWDLFYGNSWNVNRRYKEPGLSCIHILSTSLNMTDLCQQYKLMLSSFFFLTQKSIQLQLQLSLRTMD